MTSRQECEARSMVKPNTSKKLEGDLLRIEPTSQNIKVSSETASITFTSTTSKEEWAEALRGITAIERVSLFMLGDALIFGEKLHGKKLAYKTASEITGKAESLLRNAVMVAKAIPPQERFPQLGLDAHKAVVPMLKMADKKAAEATKLTDAKQKKQFEGLAMKLRTAAHAILKAGGTVMDIRKKVADALGRKPAKKKVVVASRQEEADQHMEDLEEAATFLSTLTLEEVKRDGKAFLFSLETVLDMQRQLRHGVIQSGVMSTEEASVTISLVSPPLATRDNKG